ncbi:energy-coupling factor transporter transmembrane protein EcfT [Janibacter melonis]|uniref:Energy-coupling factor transporter transmembrane protein EcfT n=1 Tax=Janibacter melonis TaxID=262209 RepID=A0A5P8FLB7_9MICO|nr:energy-coupling factor transporter transmembrane component T [Janibacter melonis]QFQ29850.2 energy-coupling factor transporter transmembrane protein EcfT [Janibacter melonis]
MTPPLPRAVHPGAWWLWAIALAVGVSATTNPLLLLLAISVVTFVVVSRRPSTPWARAFRLYVWLGVLVVVLRLVLHVLLGLKWGETVLLELPSATLPSWAAGIDLLGTVRLEGLLAAGLEGLRLATMILCVGAANALANPKRLLAALPGALHEIGAAVVVAITVAPQLAESVQRVLRARRLRGDAGRGLRAFRRVAMPVLQDTLDRSLMLASAMDSRGYGRRGDVPLRRRRLVSGVTLASLLAICLGVYGLLDTRSPAWIGTPMLVGGIGLGALGLRLGSAAVHRTVYRPDPWRGAEWLVLACGVAGAAGVLAAQELDPLGLSLPLQPLGAPALPWTAALGLLLAALPGVLTPLPPVTRASAARRASGAPARAVATPQESA